MLITCVSASLDLGPSSFIGCVRLMIPNTEVLKCATERRRIFCVLHGAEIIQSVPALVHTMPRRAVGTCGKCQVLWHFYLAVKSCTNVATEEGMEWGIKTDAIFVIPLCSGVWMTSVQQMFLTNPRFFCRMQEWHPAPPSVSLSHVSLHSCLSLSHSFSSSISLWQVLLFGLWAWDRRCSSCYSLTAVLC